MQLRHSISAMQNKFDEKKPHAVRCPTCGAAPGERCELTSGQPRITLHRDRRVIAKDTTLVAWFSKKPPESVR